MKLTTRWAKPQLWRWLVNLNGMGYQQVRRLVAWCHPYRYPLRLLGLMVVLNTPKLVLVAYAPNHISHPGIAFDTWFYHDEYYILKALEGDHSLQQVVRWFSGNWVEQTPTPYYRPLTSVSLWLDYLVWRQNHQGYLLTSWVLQCLTGWLLALLGAKVLHNAPCGVLTGVAFAWLWLPSSRTVLHHMSTRTDGLCAVWMLVSLLGALKWVETGKRAWFLATNLAALAALWSKEMAAVLPCLVALCGLFAARGKNKQRLLLLVATLTALVAFWALVYRLLLPEAFPNRWQLLRPSRVLWQFWMVPTIFLPWVREVVMWLSPLVFPWGFLVPKMWGAVALSALTIGAVWLVFRVIPSAFWFALGWIAIAWLPLLPVRIVAPHYDYIPSFSVYIFCGSLLVAVGELVRQRKFAAQRS